MPIDAQAGGRSAPRLRFSLDFWRAMLAVAGAQPDPQAEVTRVLTAALTDGYSITELLNAAPH